MHIRRPPSDTQDMSAAAVSLFNSALSPITMMLAGSGSAMSSMLSIVTAASKPLRPISTAMWSYSPLISDDRPGTPSASIMTMFGRTSGMSAGMNDTMSS